MKIGNSVIEVIRRKFIRKLECPICNNRAEHFLPLPDLYKVIAYTSEVPVSVSDLETLNIDNYSCPNCGSSDRERLYYLFIKKQSLSDSRILHFSPEGALERSIKKQINYREYITTDFERCDVDERIDIRNIDKYEDESIDFFICSHVLEHVDDDEKAISELYRILKKNGRGILMVPVALNIQNTYEDPSIVTPVDRVLHFGQEDHVRIYSKIGFLKRVSAHGFVVKQYGWQFFGKKIYNKNAITLSSVLYVVEKI